MTGAATTRADGRRLTEVVTVLWPGGTGTSPPLRALPSATTPRLVVPRRPLRAAAAAVRNHTASATGRRRRLLQMASYAVRFGLADLIGDPVPLPPGDGTAGIDRHLSLVLGRPAVVAVQLGPLRAVQKPVLQLVTPGGDTFAFAKLGTGDLTDRLIRTEVSALHRLAATRHAPVHAPRLLHAGQWCDHELVVLSAVPGDGRPIPHHRLVAATGAVAQSLGVRRVAWEHSTYRTALLERISALPPSLRAARLRHALELVEGSAEGTELDFGCWHGDWAPWNMSGADDRVTAWDWEHFAEDVPVGFDAVHHDLARMVTLEGRAPVDAFTRLLRRDGGGLTHDIVPEADRTLLVTAYLLEITTRYLEHDEVGVGGTRLSRLDEWLPDAIAHCRKALGGRGG
jgi:hypothetical protein